MERAWWVYPGAPALVWAGEVDELRLVGGELVALLWSGDERVVIADEALVGAGAQRVLVLQRAAGDVRVLALGDEGSLLFEVGLGSFAVRSVAEMPRFANDAGGMCRLEWFEVDGLVVMTWELGVLVLDSSLRLRWRQDLEWNHCVVSVGSDEIWFDVMYESEESLQRVGEAPFGFGLSDGRELRGRRPGSWDRQ